MANTIVQPPIADVTKVTDPVYSYASDNGFFTASFAQTIGTDDAVKFTTNGYSFAWKPENVIYVDDQGNMDVVFGVNAQATAQVYKNRVSYVGTTQITTDVFECQENQLKHTIQMVAPPRIPAGFVGTPVKMASGGVITYDSSLQVFADGQVQTTDFEVTGDIGFKDADGNLIYKLPMITVEDADGNSTTGTYKVTFNADGTISFYGMVPWDFLQTAIYPVIIDPTVIASNASQSYQGRKLWELQNGWLIDAAYVSSSGTIDVYYSADKGTTWNVLCHLTAVSGATLTFDMCIIPGTNKIWLIAQWGSTYPQYWNFDASTITVGSNQAATGTPPNSNSNTTVSPYNSGYNTVSCAYDKKNDRVHAAWLCKNATYVAAIYGAWTQTGNYATWGNGGTEQMIEGATSGSFSYNPYSCPRLIFKNDGTGVMVYQFDDTVSTGSNRSIKFDYFDGTRWQFGATVGNQTGTYYQQSPTVGKDTNDNILVAWHGLDTSSTTYYNIWFNKSSGTTGSSMFSTSNAKNITAQNTYDQKFPTLTVEPNSGKVRVIYQGKSASSTSYFQIREIDSTDGGTTWTQQPDHTNATTDQTYPCALFDLSVSDAVRWSWYSSSSAISFDYISLNQPPNAPTLAQKSNFDAAQDAVFTATYSDPDSGDTMSARQLQIYDTANTSTPAYDTGKVGQTTTVQNQQFTVTVPANTLTNGKSYQWREMTWDSSGVASPWSGYSTFSTSAAPVATVTSPASGGTVTSDSYTFTGAYSQPNGVVEQSFQFKLWDQAGTTIVQDSGTIVGTSNAKTFSGLANNTPYNVEFITTSQDGVSASSGKIPFSVSYTPPATPSVTAMNNDVSASVIITFSNPTPSGTQPTVSSNNVYRRKVGETTWRLIKQGATSPYCDYTCPLGDYEYGVTGVSSAGATSDYGTSQVTTSFTGEWVVDESNPANNVVFLYNQRESDATVNQSYNAIQTFAKYPRIRKGQARYRTGNLTALKLSQDGDVISQVDAIDNMCNSDGTYLLKSVNGRIYRVSLSQFKYTGKYGNNIADCSVVWTEVGDV